MILSQNGLKLHCMLERVIEQERWCVRLRLLVRTRHMFIVLRGEAQGHPYWACMSTRFCYCTSTCP